MNFLQKEAANIDVPSRQPIKSCQEKLYAKFTKVNTGTNRDAKEISGGITTKRARMRLWQLVAYASPYHSEDA